MAEGSPKSQETSEPETRLRTTTMPAINLREDDLLAAAETGTVTAVRIGAEGHDNDDVQDESIHSGEPEKPGEARFAIMKADTKPKVLIIEDTAELAEVIQATLEAMSLETYHESHGTSALATYLKIDPEIVLLDIGLPDMTGWKIMEEIKARQEETDGQMPIVIVITAYDDPANRLVGKLQDIHNYLVKPFTADEIENVIREALSGTV